MQKLVAGISVCALSVAAIAASAQITKGVKLLGGSVGYNAYSVTEDFDTKFTPEKRSSFSAAPAAGFFIADNVAVGISPGFSTNKTVLKEGVLNGPNSPVVVTRTDKEHSVSIAPFLRYYYLPIENFGIYGQVSAGYALGRFDRDIDQSSNVFSANTREVFAAITPALVFFPINKLGLELTCGSVGYSRAKRIPQNLPVDFEGDGFITSRFGASFGLSSLALGASYYIGR
ncbi:PorT family protein [Hymenobacter weizhouensis]|uniref:PorT family protein n=1 Tax=Hymenobacter sp. YIM 151500-1 TaxID=2987689 RepID=UPI002226D13C|nr:PorT family protein [Hymenobacter sp. YIM 151500-1]UYZ62172.1 PorT family protein [Hymenobacter sp. YIM 151500-1]